MLKKIRIVILLISLFTIGNGCAVRKERQNKFIEYKEKDIGELGKELMALNIPKEVVIMLVGVGDALFSNEFKGDVHSRAVGSITINVLGKHWERIEPHLESIKSIFIRKISPYTNCVSVEEIERIVYDLILYGEHVYKVNKIIPDYLKDGECKIDLRHFNIIRPNIEGGMWERNFRWRIEENRTLNGGCWNLINDILGARMAVLNEIGEIIG